MKVHIVEDDIAAADSLTMLLESWGVHALSSYSGEEFLSCWQPQDTEIVLLDINLPGINGVEVLRSIRRQSPSTSVAIITGGVNPALEEEALSLGIREILRKPVEEHRLREIIPPS